jgi:hypothetical protein
MPGTRRPSSQATLREAGRNVPAGYHEGWGGACTHLEGRPCCQLVLLLSPAKGLIVSAGAGWRGYGHTGRVQSVGGRGALVCVCVCVWSKTAKMPGSGCGGALACGGAAVIERSHGHGCQVVVASRPGQNGMLVRALPTPFVCPPHPPAGLWGTQSPPAGRHGPQGPAHASRAAGQPTPCTAGGGASGP